MDAVVMAGGVPQPGEPLYEETRGRPKSLLDVAGKPMVQWVLEALDQAEGVERVVLVGLAPEDGLHSRKLAAYLPEQGGLLKNMQVGAAALQQHNPAAEYGLFVSGDIPALTGQMVDWLLHTVARDNVDIYYNVVARETMEARFPGANRTYTRFRDVEVCGGDMNVGRLRLLTDESGPWGELIRRRKHPLAQAALIGFDTLLLLALHRLTLQDMVERVTRKFGLSGRAILNPYPEIAMDVDKPHQLALLRRHLQTRTGGPAPDVQPDPVP